MLFLPAGCYIRRLHRSESENIRSVIFGPWVQALASTFDEIDYVRREGGFRKPFIGIEETPEGVARH